MTAIKNGLRNVTGNERVTTGNERVHDAPVRFSEIPAKTVSAKTVVKPRVRKKGEKKIIVPVTEKPNDNGKED